MEYCLSNAAILLHFFCRHIQNEASAKIFEQVCAGLEVSCHAWAETGSSVKCPQYRRYPYVAPVAQFSLRARMHAPQAGSRRLSQGGCSAILTCEDARANWPDVM